MNVIARTLLYCAALAASAAAAAQGVVPGGSAPAAAVTARPPLQAMPATRVSGQVQQRLRACNAQADANRLTAAARESFLKSCLAARRARRQAPAVAASAARPAGTASSAASAPSAH